MLRKLLMAALFVLPAAMIMADDVPLQFDWAFVKCGPDGSPRAINFSEKVNIAPGDLFKISIQPLDNAYIYLVLQDAGGDLQLLFPDRFTDFESGAYLRTQTFIPAGENWFTLDNAHGTERFHLLASATRLAALENLVLAYQKTARDKGNVRAAGQAVMDEIARQRRIHSQLTAPVERPVTIAAGTRGINGATARLATRIGASSFYAKTFRLQH